MKIRDFIRRCHPGFVLIAVIVLALLAPGRASAACTGGANLKGYYGMLVTGPSATTGYGKYLTGSLYSNGACALSAAHLTGGINQKYADAKATGSYTTNANGSISIKLSVAGESKAETYTVGMGKTALEAFGLETDGTAVATIVLTPQNWTSGYTLATLKSAYSLSCNNTNGNYSDLNMVTFDGKGGITGIDVYNNEGDQGTESFTGTYTVATDGTFTAILAGYFKGYTITGVMSHATQWIYYTYGVSGTGGVASCVGKN